MPGPAHSAEVKKAPPKAAPEAAVGTQEDVDTGAASGVPLFLQRQSTGLQLTPPFQPPPNPLLPRTEWQFHLDPLLVAQAQLYVDEMLNPGRVTAAAGQVTLGPPAAPPA
ncbi:MAG: hypothetical protein SGI92_05345, partial [Bryobacteraceae bacterium]|nr:hypothetical protein [Bryobacteraceae bacterium]